MRNDLDNEYFLAKLNDEKTRLIGELKTLGQINPNNPADWEAIPTQTEHTPDYNEKADSFEQSEENNAILNQLEIELALTNDALKRIEDNIYGVCEECHGDIEKDRLEAYPAARNCINHNK